MSKVDLKVTGVRGGDPSFSENKGRVEVFVDSTTDYIAIDAFKGGGDSYKRRKESEITISIDGHVWSGTKEELLEQLGLVKAKPLNKQQQITKHFDAYLSGGEELSYTKIHAALKKALKEKPDYMVESITVRHNGEDVNIDLIEDLQYTTVKRFCEMCGIE